MSFSQDLIEAGLGAETKHYT